MLPPGPVRRQTEFRHMSRMSPLFRPAAGLGGCGPPFRPPGSPNNQCGIVAKSQKEDRHKLPLRAAPPRMELSAPVMRCAGSTITQINMPRFTTVNRNIISKYPVDRAGNALSALLPDIAKSISSVGLIFQHNTPIIRVIGVIGAIRGSVLIPRFQNAIGHASAREAFTDHGD